MPNAKARKERAWADVRMKAINIGLIGPDKTLTQLKRNYIHSTINITKGMGKAPLLVFCFCM